MKSHFASAAAAVLLATTPLAAFLTAPATAQTASAQAELQTVTFDVENMTCATCPITVRLAMEAVEGVRSVEVEFETKTATVVFDPATASPAAIGAASTNAGYPAAARS